MTCACERNTFKRSLDTLQSTFMSSEIVYMHTETFLIPAIFFIQLMSKC